MVLGRDGCGGQGTSFRLLTILSLKNKKERLWGDRRKHRGALHSG